LSEHKLILGDCLDELPKIFDKNIDLVLTDPPYGTTKCKWDSVIPFEPMWNQLKRVIKDNGCIALFGSEPFSSALRMSNIDNYKYDWIWQKTIPTGMATSSYMPMKYHEIISIFIFNGKPCFNKQLMDRSENGKVRAKTPIYGNPHKSNHIKLTKQKAKQYNPLKVNPKSVLNFSSVNNSKGKLHPTQKPVALLEYLIKTYTNENDTVLDFTMGSGSTGVACKNLNRNFIGIEKDENYYNIAKQRIEGGFVLKWNKL